MLYEFLQSMQYHKVSDHTVVGEVRADVRALVELLVNFEQAVSVSLLAQDISKRCRPLSEVTIDSTVRIRSLMFFKKGLM